LVDCPSGDTVKVLFENNTDTSNPFTGVESSYWTINGVVYNVVDTILEFNKYDDIQGVLHVMFSSDCVVESAFNLNVQDLLPQANYDILQLSCDDRHSTNILVIYNEKDTKGLETTDIKFDIQIGDIVLNNASDSTYLTIPKDSIMTLTLYAEFENGCTDTLTETFIPGPYATLNMVDNGILCPGTEVHLVQNPYPNLSYTWSPTDYLDLTVPSNPVAIPLQTITYYVTVSDGVCEILDSVFFEVLDGLVVDIQGDNYTCDGNIDLTATGAFGEGQYQWSLSSDFDPIINEGETLNYYSDKDLTFYVRWSGNECDVAGDSIMVNYEGLQLLTADPLTLCRNDTTVVNVFSEVPTHNVVWHWEDNSHIVSGQDTNELLIGIGEDEVDSFDLYLTATNQFACVVYDTITIVIGDAPIVDMSLTRGDCGNLTVCFEVVGEYNSLPIWDFGDPTTEDDKSFQDPVCYTYPSTGTYTVELSNASTYCPFMPISKTFNIADGFDFGGLDDYYQACKGDVIHLSVPSEYFGFESTWVNSFGEIISEEDEFDYIVDGNDVIRLTIKDDFGCNGSLEITISDLSDVEININHSVTECGELEVCFELVGEYLGQIFWDFGDPSVAVDTTSEATPCYTYNQPGTYTITVTNISDYCNFDTIRKEITIRDTFEFPGLDSLSGCYKELITLTVPFEYQDYQVGWYTQDTILLSNENEIVIELTQDSTIRLQIIDDNGCEANKDVFINLADFDFELILPEVFCFGGESDVFFNGNPNYTYFWEPEDCVLSGQGSADVVLKNQDGKEITITITNLENGCSTTTSFVMTTSSPDIEITSDPEELFLGSDGTISVVDPVEGYSYVWNTGETGTSISVSPSEDTQYCVTVTDDFGCENSTCLTLHVLTPQCDETDVYIPNAFSPNGDGVNDILYVRSNYIDEFTMIIYNRWGQEVFKTSSLGQGWDGKFNNQDLSPDAYAYYILVKCTDGEEYTKRGNISLLR
ncbi:MAG TPA: gliding motility-associated C-terminal domain-containing protein, partial [Saprospiraceae bacterium]|nr:gliding motility-associated C-terminal domain-containing protein [Saprospiraceae bacterium]